MRTGSPSGSAHDDAEPSPNTARATGPSRDDATALIQLANLHAQLQVSAGLDVLWRADFPTDPYTIDAWFAPGTDGRRGPSHGRGPRRGAGA
jgi:hypothetical protein